ncbi:MAG: sacsin N-terminal ATP-binding-like domain-containing protein [Pseudonocardia sp.]
MLRPDPFDTASLRAGVLAAWADSPTRFREDANAEEDLLLGGYADRWLVELAQNAADAAQRSGRMGRMLVTVVCGPAGAELRVANTGAPLDAAGVAALASLRASTKRDTDAVGRFGVGFAAVLGVSDQPRLVSVTGGVRFSAAATRAAVERMPGTASAELARRAGRPPVLRLPWPVPGEEPAPPPGYDTEVRLPLRPGTDRTAANLTGGDLAAAAALTAAADLAAPDLLIALPCLAEITVVHPDCADARSAGASLGADARSAGASLGADARSAGAALGADARSAGASLGRRVEHRREDHPDGTVTLQPGEHRWLLVRRTGELRGDREARAVEERPGWTVCWALPLSTAGLPAPLTGDVLHAPTPSDERLGLPARLIAGLPMQPSRRRVRPGPAVDEVVRAAAGTYLELVLAVRPHDRAVLAPAPGFPLGELDDALRTAVSAVLDTAAWLPAAHPKDAPTADPPMLAPRQARLLDLPGASALAGLVVDAVPELLAAGLDPAARPALTALGARPLGLAELADRLAAPRWSPQRWRAVYAALADAVDGVPGAREELAGLPVPLVDGRTVSGPRGVLVLDGAPGWVDAVTAQLAALALPGVRIAHPEAAHPLLRTLGAVGAGPAEVLDHPALMAAVGRSDEVWDREPGASAEGSGPHGLAGLVLGLLTELGGVPGSSAGPGPRVGGAAGSGPRSRSGSGGGGRGGSGGGAGSGDGGAFGSDGPGGGRSLGAAPTARPWLGALALPDADGLPRRADELMFADAAIRPLLAPDAPLGVLERGLAGAFPRAVLTAVGVLDSFAVLVDDDPAGPDHDLDEEDRWWNGLDRPPSTMLAVRDLDLVDDHAWPEALALLAADPAGLGALRAEHSYTGWWLARHARLAGRRPGHWRTASAAGLAGLFDPVPGQRLAGLPEDVLAAAGVRRDLDVRGRVDAEELLGRLADRARTPDAGLTWRVHAALAAAVLAGRVDPDDLDPPRWLRSSAGTVLGADRAVLLDHGWLAPALPAEESVAGMFDDPELTGALADLLDLPLASEVIRGTVVSGTAVSGTAVSGTGVSGTAVSGTAVSGGASGGASGAGRPERWSALVEVVAACATLGVAVPEGRVWLHDELVVELTRPASARITAAVWRERDGTWHTSDPVRALLARLVE